MKKYPISYVESLNGVLTQELVRFNRLLETIKSNLKGIKLSLQGKIVLNPSILEVAHSLVKDKVPDLWLKKSYPSLKPLGSYLEDLKERVTFFQNWIEFGQPTVFWISSFFSIQSFINGILQNFARKYAIPVNEVVFNFYFLKDKPEVKPEDGAYIEGLFLEGCRWNYDWMGLDESEPKKLYT